MNRVVQDLTREELDELKQSYICVMKEGSSLHIGTIWQKRRNIYQMKHCLNIMTA